VLVLAALIAIGAAVAALVWHSGNGVFSIHHSTPRASGPAIAVAAVTAYDPYGSPPGEEHNADAPMATDRNTGTFWETERYHSTFAALGKQGVGLVLDVKRPLQLHRIVITTTTPGFVAVIRAGDSTGSSAGLFPDTVSASQTVGNGTILTISGGRHRYYLLWITSLPPGGQTVRINEVKAS
jgi:hypothetical protein